ncbi:MAG: hypothetical protein GX301_02660 [Gracilibacteraceae bacterium]|jgi:hypothetical protein|nr:hypothetical protein [Gracilibacteraceae bacterium]
MSRKRFIITKSIFHDISLELYAFSNPPNILPLSLGKNRKITSSIIHQLPFEINPLTVLLIPPKSSPAGKAGMEKGRENRLRAGVTAG